MSGWKQHNQVALMCINDQAITQGIVKSNILEIDFRKRQPMLETAQVVFRREVHNTEPANIVQRVCKRPAEIIMLQKKITDVQAQQFVPPQCDHTEMENPIQIIKVQGDEAQRRPVAPGRDDKLWEELAVMTQNAWQSGDEVHHLRMQLPNALRSAARASPAAPQAPEDRGQKNPDSLDCADSDRTQFRCWIAQLRMVIRHKPATASDAQSMIRYAFNCLSRVSLGQIMWHIRESGEIGLEDPSPLFNSRKQLLVTPTSYPLRKGKCERSTKWTVSSLSTMLSFKL